MKQHLPATTWLARKLGSRIARRIYAALGLSLVLSVVVLRISATRAEKHAAILLNDMLEIRLHPATEADVERLHRRYSSQSELHGICEDTCSLTVRFSNWQLLNEHWRLANLILVAPDLQPRPLFRVLHRAGFRFYAIEGWVFVKGGHVTKAGYQLAISTPEAWNLIAWAGSMRLSRSRSSSSYWVGTVPGGCSGCEAIYTGLTAAATDAEIRKAFDVNVHCVSQLWHSCTTFAEIMPSASRDLPKD